MSEQINEAIEEKVADASTDVSEENAPPAREVIFEEALEAILFAAGHPISYATLARVFEMQPSEVKEKVIEYSLVYNSTDMPRGVILLTYADSCQLCTKKYYLNEIREALGIKKSGTLSTSSLEALAIVAYNQPVTRAFVDTLRRADSSYAMNNLLDRGLIESKGRLDAPGRPMLYGTTTDFLRAFGIKDLASLPKTTEEMKEMFEKANPPAQDELVQEEIEIEEKKSDSAEEIDTVAQDTSDTVPSGESSSYEDEHSAEDDIINSDND